MKDCQGPSVMEISFSISVKKLFAGLGETCFRSHRSTGHTDFRPPMAIARLRPYENSIHFPEMPSWVGRKYYGTGNSSLEIIKSFLRKCHAPNLMCAFPYIDIRCMHITHHGSSL